MQCIFWTNAVMNGTNEQFICITPVFPSVVLYKGIMLMAWPTVHTLFVANALRLSDKSRIQTGTLFACFTQASGPVNTLDVWLETNQSVTAACSSIADGAVGCNLSAGREQLPETSPDC